MQLLLNQIKVSLCANLYYIFEYGNSKNMEQVR